MKATLKYYQKNIIQNRYILELSIHEVGKSSKYPLGIKYGLICKDLENGDYVLLDNHHPKGPHVHINRTELNYNFINEDKLIEDFKKIVFDRLGIKL